MAHDPEQLSFSNPIHLPSGRVIRTAEEALDWIDHFKTDPAVQASLAIARECLFQAIERHSRSEADDMRREIADVIRRIDPAVG